MISVHGEYDVFLKEIESVQDLIKFARVVLYD